MFCGLGVSDTVETLPAGSVLYGAWVAFPRVAKYFLIPIPRTFFGIFLGRREILGVPQIFHCPVRFFEVC